MCVPRLDYLLASTVVPPLHNHPLYPSTPFHPFRFIAASIINLSHKKTTETPSRVFLSNPQRHWDMSLRFDWLPHNSDCWEHPTSLHLSRAHNLHVCQSSEISETGFSTTRRFFRLSPLLVAASSLLYWLFHGDLILKGGTRIRNSKNGAASDKSRTLGSLFLLCRSERSVSAAIVCSVISLHHLHSWMLLQNYLSLRRRSNYSP